MFTHTCTEVMSPEQSDGVFTQTNPDAAPTECEDRPLGAPDLAALEGRNPSQIEHQKPTPAIQPTMMMMGALLLNPVKGRSGARSKPNKRMLIRFSQRARPTGRKTGLWPTAKKNANSPNPARASHRRYIHCGYKCANSDTTP